MEKDPRYKAAKYLIEGKQITMFREIFIHVPKTVMAQDLGTNNNRMTRLIDHVEQFTVGELYRISELLEISYEVLFNLVHSQHFGIVKPIKKNMKNINWE